MAVEKEIKPMSKRSLFAVLFIGACVITAVAQRKLPKNTGTPPNYDYYTLNPEYDGPPKKLGWSDKVIEEKLGRGLVALAVDQGKVYLSWRFLKSDPATLGFNVYRSTAGGTPLKLNAAPIVKTTDFVDAKPPLDRENAWFVRPVLSGQEQEPSGRAALPANPPVQQYISFKVRDDIPVNSVNKIGMGDLDGDGEYDFVIKRPGGGVDPGTIRRSPDTFKIEGYKRDGTFLWRNDLGWSIELGVWYSPMIVWDFNGDGRAEVALKTGEGDPRGPNGQVLTGPEYVSVWDGQTGKTIARENWIERRKPEDWGDNYGNRMNREMIGVAYLDGKTPALLVHRGQYGLMLMDLWLLQGDKLEKAWRWSNETSGFKYQGQGAHTIHVADIDNDGFDEILNGTIAIDQDGRIIYGIGMGHADRFFVTDIIPERPGLESVYCFEDPAPKDGLSMYDARTGYYIAGAQEETNDNQVGRALVADIDPTSPGMEWWGDKFFFAASGKSLGPKAPPQDGLVWWDGDLVRELQSRGTVFKWNGPELTKGIEGQVQVWADIIGDWREEIITYQKGEVRVYTTILPATDRRPTLMQDPIYRKDVAFKAMGYDQPPMTSFYLGSKSVAKPAATKK
jgi:rhamnogalacturonan endolyase